MSRLRPRLSLFSLNVETETETKIKDGHTNLIWLENTKKIIEIQIDLTNKVKLINNKQE